MNSTVAVPINEYRRFSVLGVRVDAVQIPDVIARIEEWTADRDGHHYVVVADMHVAAEARCDPEFQQVLKSADMIVPDGMPLVWLGRLHGYRLRQRVSGPELMAKFFQTTTKKGYRHFFYGGAPGVPERLAENFRQCFPDTVVAGTYSPPFRKLTTAEDSGIVEMIRHANPDIVWVGLGAPKQERWMYEHHEDLNVPVLVGVGAAFDIHAGVKRKAPVWMGEHGLEWLFRLMQEPRRLWYRYLVQGPQFVFWVTLEMIKRRKHQ